MQIQLTGLTTMAMEDSIFSSGGFTQRILTYGIWILHGSCRIVSNMPRTVAASTYSTISATARFEEVSEKVGISSRRWALASSSADLRGTGHPDLFVANDYGVSELYINDGQRFHERGEQTGVGFAPKSGMNVAFGDVLNQGKLSVYVSNISEEGVLIQGNNLWVPKDGSSSETIRFENAHAISEWSWAGGASALNLAI